MARIAVIKLGSSVVADDDGTLRASVLDAVVAETAKQLAAGTQVVIVSSGAIACGLPLLGLAGRPTKTEELQATSAVGQGRLFREWEQRFSAQGVVPAQVLLTFADLSAREHFLNSRRTFEQLLAWGVVPIVNENDTTSTEEISFGDNDVLAAQVAMLIGADELILLTSTEGLFTANPATDPTAELVGEVDDISELADLKIDRATSTHGSGGMRSKVVSAEMATAAGVPVTICSARAPQPLIDVLAGRPAGTRFLPGQERHSSFKLWLRYAKPSKGVIVV